MPAQRLAILTLLIGLAVGVALGSLLLGDGPAPVNAATRGTGLAPDDVASGARAAGPVDRLVPVVAGPATTAAPEAGSIEAAVARDAEEASQRVAARAEAPADEGEEATWTEAIRGTVVDADGNPLAGATVVTGNDPDRSRSRALGSSTAQVGRPWTGFGDLDDSLAGRARAELASRRRTRVATTDAEGRFVLERLRPGTHRLRAYAEGLVFDQESVETGDPARLVGRPVSIFVFDVRLPDGTQPERATVRVGDDDRPTSYAWTPEEPELRLEDPTIQVEVIAGDVRSLDWRNVVGEYTSPRRSLDLERDGEGPHVFELTAAQLLTVTVEDTSGLRPRPPTWVKLLPADDLGGRSLEAAFEDATRVTHDEGRVYVATELKPGRYLIGAGRGGGAPEVTETVDVTAGGTEVTLELGEIDLSRFLVVRSTGPDGRPVDDVEFRRTFRRSSGSRSGGASAIERPDGETWLAWDSLTDGEPFGDDGALTLTATSDAHGSLEVEIKQRLSELALQFQPPCELTVQVTGDVSPGFSVSVAPVKEDADPNHVFFGGRSGSSAKVDDEGRALITDLQPGKVKVSLMKTGRERFRGWGQACAEQELVLRSGTQRIDFVAPTFHTLTVLAPDLKKGENLSLNPDKGEQAHFGGQTAEVDADGRAHFPEVAAGAYVLQSWGANQGSMKVTVPSGEVVFQPQPVDAYRLMGLDKSKAGAKAGLEEGDLVVAIDGADVAGQVMLQRFYLDVLEKSVTLTVERGGNTLDVPIGPFEGVSNAWSELGFYLQPSSR